MAWRMEQTREIDTALFDRCDAEASDDLTLNAAEASKRLIFEIFNQRVRLSQDSVMHILYEHAERELSIEDFSAATKTITALEGAVRRKGHQALIDQSLAKAGSPSIKNLGFHQVNANSI